jgi:hypothetical protein
MTYTLGVEPRWALCRRARPIDPISWPMPIVAAIGDYDVLYDTNNKCYTVTCNPQTVPGFNFTDFFVRSDGIIDPGDGDVILDPGDDEIALDPYHMCLLYQMHAEVGHRFEFEY